MTSGYERRGCLRALFCINLKCKREDECYYVIYCLFLHRLKVNITIHL